MIFDNLKIMLSSETEEQWDDAYQDARSIISSYPREKSYLDKIYNNPKYYSRYCVKSILCNLTKIGSVPAEENHSFNVAHMGSGASWSLCKMVSELIEKQQQHAYKYKRKEENWYFPTFFFKHIYLEII